MDFEFSGEVWELRGPAPYHFVSVPAEQCDDLWDLAADVTYGWGMIPVRVVIGDTTWETSLWPRDGGYALPLKDRVRDAEGIVDGRVVQVGIDVVTRDGRPVQPPEGVRPDVTEK